MTKFYEEFCGLTKNEFSMLKFNSATYLKDARKLVVRFIISAFDANAFSNEQKAKVLQVVQNMFPGVSIAIEYIKAYADCGVVKNKIIEFFNKTNPIILSSINDDSMTIDVDDFEIAINFTLITPMYVMLTSGNILEKLNDYLDRIFMQNVYIQTEEVKIDLREYVQKANIQIDTSVASGSAHLVEIELKDKIYTRSKTENNVPQMPVYIQDIKGVGENVVICGKISNVRVAKYKNKKYKPDDPKSGPEEKPIIKFWLDDSTSRIECVCFPRVECEDAFANIPDKSEVVCVGNVSVSSYNNMLSFAANSMFYCGINYDSIHLKESRPAPKVYKTIMPQPFVDTRQHSLLDEEKCGEVPQFLKGKTFVIYDLEATDKVPDKAEIIEIAALKIVDGKEVETFQSLICPPYEISEEITALTSISNEMVMDKPSIDEVVPDFFKFSRDSVLVGHNISGYDYPLLKKYTDRLGYNLDNELVDTLLLARKYLTELPNFKLETISKFFTISHENAHRAMSDVMATCEVLKILAKRMG